MFGYKGVINTDANDPDRRVGLVVRSGFGLSGVVLVAVGAALALGGAQGAWWLLPLLLAGIALYAVLRTLSIPSWAINVPDNEVWMVIDADNHIERFIGSGVHRIKPAQRAIPYPEKGLLEIPIELDRVMTADHYAYRVRVRIRILLDPLQAERGKFALLRTMTRDNFNSMIYDDVVAVVMRELRQRAQIDTPALTAALEEALRRVIADHRALGVLLAARHDVTVEVIPPDAIIAARTEQWVRQTESETHTSHIAGLLSTAEEHNLSPGELGALHFAVNPPSGMQVNLGGDHGLFAPGAPVRRQTPNDATTAPPAQPTLPSGPPPPLLPNPIPAGLPASTAANDYVANPPPSNAPDPDVIETEQDDDGTYIPSNPIRPRKKR
jgi:hypothetical protein